MKGFKILLMLILTTAVVIWLDTKINEYDLNYYQGKDNGFSVRFYSICMLSSLFFVLMSRRKRGLLSVIGVFVGILSIIVSYFIWFMLFEDRGLSFHIIACVLVALQFMLFRYFNPSLASS